MAIRLPSIMKLMCLVPAMALAPVSGPVTAQDAAAAPAPAPAEKFGFYGDVTYGNPDGVEVIEFMSLTCGHCAHFEAMELPQIKQELIESGKVKFVIRNFLLNELDLAMAVTARCRDEGFARKAFNKILLEQSSWLQAPKTGPERMEAITTLFTSLGMERDEMMKCLNNQDLAQHLIRQREADAEKHQVSGTPTLMVEGVVIPGHKASVLIDYVKHNFADRFDK